MFCCNPVSYVNVFVFKQKTAYELSISDWSSDVCSSDLCRYQLSDVDGCDCTAAAGRRREGRLDERPQAPERPVMRETRADSTQAVVLAIALHAFLFALMFVGLWWNRDAAPIAAAGSPISAEMVDTSELSTQMRRALARDPEPLPEPEPEPAPPQVEEEEAAPLPQPIPEPAPQESPVPKQQQAQDFVPEPSPVEQEKVDRNAIAAEKREREQEETRRQEQIDLTARKKQEEVVRKGSAAEKGEGGQEEKRRQEQIDRTERKKQGEAGRKVRLAEQQRDEKLKKIQAERAKAEREARLAEQKLKQIADLRVKQASEDAAASAPPPPGNEGVDTGLRARYAAAIQAAVLSNWTRPETVPPGQVCVLSITQLPGGDVMTAKVDPSCPYDELGRRSVEAAVLKAKPLPYAGFESVFQRNLILNFEAQDR